MDFRHQVPPTMTTPEPILSNTPPLTPPGTPATPPITPMPVQPLSAPLAPAVAPVARRSLKWLWWSLGGVVLAGILGGGYFAYSRGYLAIPFLTPKEDQLFTRFIDSLTEINNAQYKVQVGLKSEARSGGATSVFPNADERKAESNDAKRKSDIGSIRTALVSYFTDNKKYPDSIETALSPKYLTTLPTDPKDKSQYKYQSCEEGKHYVLQTGLESDEYYYVADAGYTGTTDKVPACGQNTNVSRGLLNFLLPTAHAQATSFSIESIGTQVGLGEPESNYPFLGLLDIFGLGDLESMIDVFPSDIDAAAAVTFYAEADKQLQDANALLAISGSYRGDDLTAEFDVEARKLGSTMYGIVRKFPGIPYLSKYISPIKNSWIKVEPGDGNPLLRADTFKQASIKSGVESVRQSLKDALDGEIVTLDKSLGTESIAGVQSAHYRVALHPDKVKAVLEKIVIDRRTKNLDTVALEDAIKQLDKAGTLTSLERLVDNSTVDIWVDKVKGYLRQMSWSIVLVPPDDSEKLKDKQLRLTLTLTLDKVNQNVDVGRPGDAIDYAEAERKVTGISVEQQKFNRQRSQIDAIGGALKQIRDMNGAYPESITTIDADLKQSLDACKIKKDQPRNTNAYVYVYCNDHLLDNGSIVVKDIYTNKPYGYSRVGDDYNLTYEMKLDFTDPNSEYSYGSYYKDNYVEGKNTATSKDDSIEKETASEIADKKHDEALNANKNKNTNATQTNTNTSVTEVIVPAISTDEKVRGTGSYTLIEYADLDCPYCAQFGKTMRTIMEQYHGKVRWVYRQFPLSFHAISVPAANGALCVQQLGTTTQYWRYIELLTMEKNATGELSTLSISKAATDVGIDAASFASCQSSADIATRLQAIVAGGNTAGVDGTPTAFLVDTSGKVVATFAGAMTLSSVMGTLNSYVQPNTVVRDSDGDGLSDDAETYIYWTDPNKTDTDGDTYSDKSEVDGGYNPNGTGKALSSQLQLWGTATSTTTTSNTNSNLTNAPTAKAPTILAQTVTTTVGQATVTWSTDVPADGIVNYGKTLSYGQFKNNTAFTTTHGITFSTEPGITYHYSIRTCVQDLPATTGCTTSQDYNFVAQ